MALSRNNFQEQLAAFAAGFDPPNLFRVERTGTGAMQVQFRPSTWLFDLVLTFWWQDGAWHSNGSLEINPTRLFNLAGSLHNFEPNPAICRETLLRLAFSEVQPTLDGRENMVPDRLLSAAMRTSWPTLCADYIDAICDAVQDAMNTYHEIDHRIAEQRWILTLPPPIEWTLKEVEVYAECHDELAIARVHEMSAVLRSMSQDYFRQEYPAVNLANSGALGEGRVMNSASLRVGLRRDCDLSIYAKAHDRIRFEIGYRESPLDACGLRVSDFSNGSISRVLTAITANARNRLNRFRLEYSRVTPYSPPLMVSLTNALDIVRRACANDGALFQRTIASLAVNGGLSASANSAEERMRAALIAEDVLERARLRADRVPYTLTSNYRSVFHHLAHLGSVRQ